MPNQQDRSHLGPGVPVPSLVLWGRSPDADLVYRTLVTLGPRTRRQLGHELGLADTRVRNAIDELVLVDAVLARPGTVGVGTVWVSRPPSEVVAGLRRNQLPSASDRAGDATDPRAVARALPEPPLPLGDGLRHLPTRALTRARLGELVAVARHEHLAINPEPAFDASSARAAVPMDRLLLARGVRMRVLGVQAPDTDPLTRYGRLPTEPGPVYRQAPVVPMKLIVVDRKVALFPVDPHDFGRGYLEVTQPPIVSALVAMFERHWTPAHEPREGAVPTPELNPRERALISLLAQGHTDSAAAQALEVCPRTVTTILRQLMDRFEVENRFQLGLVLGAVRAVPPPSRSGQRSGDDCDV